jgi:hypothetical protein
VPNNSADPHPNVQLPQPSFWPIVLALGVLLTAVGLVSSGLISILGLVVLLAAIVGWALENRTEVHPHEHE